MQELDLQKIDEAIDAASRKHIPLTISIHSGSWVNFHSRFIECTEDHLLVEFPLSPDGVPREFVPAERVSLSFKWKHHKYLSSVRVVGVRPYRLDDGTELPVLSLCIPTQMQRIQRRNFARMEVPSGRIVRVSFWRGGGETEPTGSNGSGKDASVWAGVVSDISAGGFRAVFSGQTPPDLPEGTPVGFRISFGPTEETFRGDAEFRHWSRLDTQSTAGFRFAGLAHTAEGRKILRVIGKKMAEYSRLHARSRYNPMLDT